MSAPEFWGCTWRELGARRASFDRAHEAIDVRMASILAALHNGAVTRKDKKFWSVEMFLPDYAPAAQPENFNADRDFAVFQDRFDRMAGKKKVDPEQEDIRRQIGDRMRRAAAAQNKGAPKEDIENILRGVL